MKHFRTNQVEIGLDPRHGAVNFRCDHSLDGFFKFIVRHDVLLNKLSLTGAAAERAECGARGDYRAAVGAVDLLAGRRWIWYVLLLRRRVRLSGWGICVYRARRGRAPLPCRRAQPERIPRRYRDHQKIKRIRDESERRENISRG